MNSIKRNLVAIGLSCLLICGFLNHTLAQSRSDASAASAPSDTAQRLSKEQLTAMKKIQTESEKLAVPLALQLAQTAKQIYENMLADQENQPLRQELTTKLNVTTTELLAIKGQSIRAIVSVLTAEQKQLVKKEMQKPGAPSDLTELIGKVFHVVQP